MVKIIAVAGSKTQTMGVAAFKASFLSSMTDGHFVNVDGAVRTYTVTKIASFQSKLLCPMIVH